MPQAILAAYAEMRPRVEADRLLDLHAVLSAATGAMAKEDVTQLLRGLRSAAEGTRRRQRARKATPADLKALGIEVKERGGEQ